MENLNLKASDLLSHLLRTLHVHQHSLILTEVSFNAFDILSRPTKPSSPHKMIDSKLEE